MASKQALPDLPLKPAVLHILFALADGPMHGLGIADMVEAETEGEIRLGPGTLYRSLKEMAEAGLVESAEAPAEADPRRKYYGITDPGLEALQAETRRLERFVESARSRHLAGGA